MAKNKYENADFYPAALTIAGSDSGGGAGIEADLRTFNAYGVFGCAAICAITSQNPLKVSRIDAMLPEAVEAQIDTVMEQIKIRYAKSGMLFSASIIKTLSRAVTRHELSLICDPVMVSTSGAELLEKDAVRALCDQLLPVAKWITPNLPEAELILGRKLDDQEKIMQGAVDLNRKFGVSVLLKGGHANGIDQATDYICRDGKLYRMSSPLAKVSKITAHGTGCTLSAAITAGLSLEFPWKQALTEAKAFVYGSLTESVHIGNIVDAMYPPTVDNIKKVLLEEIK